MRLIDLVATVIVVTASGALAPGPLSFGTLIHGSKTGARSGLLLAVGHMLVEFPLVLVLALGLTVAVIQPAMRNIVGLIGGFSLICFGIMQIYEVARKIPDQSRKLSKIPRSSVLLGLILTGLNPYFLIWWFTVGSVLILQALAYSMMLGVLLMYVSHVWMDFAFLTALAHFGKRANAFLGSGYYRIVMLGFSLVLVYYGITFLILALGTVQ